MKKSNMYAEARTWNPFKGCEFDCVYCRPSFQRQAKRQKHRCTQCYHYQPHEHPEQLEKIPPTPIVFVCGNADISFASLDFTRQIIAAIKRRLKRRGDQTFFMQSKRPECFEPLLDELPENVVLLTTLETNRDEGYEKVSTAPLPGERYRQFLSLDYPRKVATVEPIMDFDLGIFPSWLINLNPENVWLGFNSRDNSVKLPEPPHDKVRELVRKLSDAGIPIKGKTLRDLTDLPGVEYVQH